VNLRTKLRNWLRRRSRRTPEENVARAEAKRQARRLREEMLAYRTSPERRLGQPYRPKND
jgi:hypothetical protein